MKTNTLYSPIIIAIFMLIVFLIISISFDVWTSLEIASQLFAALAGSAIVAIITLILLQGQSEIDNKKVKNGKIFEEKLKIYKDFYSQLCKIVTDGKISKEEELQLEFMVATLAIHTSNVHIKDISSHLRSILLNIKEGNAPVLLRELFAIGQSFKEELYLDQQDCQDENLVDAVSNFESITISKAEVDLYKRALYIKDLITQKGVKKWIYNHTTLVLELFTEKNDQGQYHPTKKRIAMDLTPMDDKFVFNIFTREYNVQATRDLVQGIWATPIQNNPQLQPFRHVVDAFDMSESDEKIAERISDWLVKVKSYRDYALGDGK